MICSKLTIHKTDIDGWYEYKQIFRVPVEDRALFHHRFVISTGDIFKGTSIELTYWEAPYVTVHKHKPISIYEVPELNEWPDGTFETIDIKMEQYRYREIVKFELIDNDKVIDYVCQEAKDNIFMAIKQRGWNHIYTRDSILNTYIQVEHEHSWRQYLGHHNRIGKVDEKWEQKRIYVTWSFNVGGYKEERLRMYA